MVSVIRIVKALFSDKRGEDYAEVSSGLSKGAKAAIAAGAIAATAAGANTLGDSANQVTDQAATRVGSPLGTGQANTPKSGGPVYK